MYEMWSGYSPMCPGGYDYGYPDMYRVQHERLVKIIQDCEAVCEDMTTYVKNRSDVEMRRMQLHLLRDCADICGLTAKFVARGSDFARDLADLCACICEACGNECAKHRDPKSQNCARICLNCARECRNFARGY